MTIIKVSVIISVQKSKEMQLQEERKEWKGPEMGTNAFIICFFAIK